MSSREYIYRNIFWILVISCCKMRLQKEEDGSIWIVCIVTCVAYQMIWSEGWLRRCQASKWTQRKLFLLVILKSNIKQHIHRPFFHQIMISYLIILILCGTWSSVVDNFLSNGCYLDQDDIDFLVGNISFLMDLYWELWTRKV